MWCPLGRLCPHAVPQRDFTGVNQVTKTSLYLAVDIGATRTAAAVARIHPDGTVSSTPFPLGRHTDSTPSAIFVGDGELLFGDAALRRGISQPERLVREFKRRIGDGTPILAGDRRFTPEQLFALLVSWVADAVAEREGERPSWLSVSIPATWGDHRAGLVAGALERAGWRGVHLISEPEAAARHYVAERSLSAGATLLVYDLGGGTFDSALVRLGSDGSVEIIGEAVGLEGLGGSDFDDAVLRHTADAAGLSLRDLAADEDTRARLAALRREAIEAKEALSFDSETVIPVLLGDGRTTVRLTRSEFESMIETDIERTVDVVSNLLSSVEVLPEDVGAILLTGGSSRIPRIAQLLSERFDRPVAVDADPKAVISLGAARAVAEGGRSPARAVAPVSDAGSVDTDTDTDIAAHTAGTHTDADVGATPAFSRPEPRRRWLGRAATIASVASGALVLGVGITVASLSFGDTPEATEPEPSPSSSPSAPAPDPSMTPTSSTTSPGPLLTPAPPGVVTDVFPPASSDPDPQQPTSTETR